jgi:hypothetical protein
MPKAMKTRLSIVVSSLMTVLVWANDQCVFAEIASPAAGRQERRLVGWQVDGQRLVASADWPPAQTVSDNGLPVFAPLAEGFSPRTSARQIRKAMVDLSELA